MITMPKEELEKIIFENNILKEETEAQRKEIFEYRKELEIAKENYLHQVKQVIILKNTVDDLKHIIRNITKHFS